MEKDIQVHNIEWTPEKVSRLWGYYATNPSYREQYFSFHSGKFILNYINRYMKLDKMCSILDYGCGPGFLLAHLLKIVKAGRCFGLDFSKKAIEQINQKFKGHPVFAEAVWVDSLPSPFGDNSMDCVFLVELVEHLGDEQLLKTMKEIYRVLKPEGYVVLTTPNEENLQANKTICPECGCIFHRWQHLRVWDVASLKKSLEREGFSTIVCRAVDFGRYTILYRLRQFYQSLTRLSAIKQPSLIYIGKKV